VFENVLDGTPQNKAVKESTLLQAVSGEFFCLRKEREGVAGFSSASVRCKQTQCKYIVTRYISSYDAKDVQDAKRTFKAFFVKTNPISILPSGTYKI